MSKRIVKRKRIKIIPLLLMLFIIVLIVFGVDFYLNTNIRNITILNTEYLPDEYIMRIAKIEDYPSYYYTTKNSINTRLLKSPFIKKVKTNKGFYHTLTIDIEESKLLFYDTLKNKYVLDNNKEVDDNFNVRVPRLTNEIPDKKIYKRFTKKMLSIDEDILSKISDITYAPNEYDKERFLLYMDDDNSVYLTLTKFKKINYYNEVLEQLEGKKGILYLDSGNHFKIMQ